MTTGTHQTAPSPAGSSEELRDQSGGGQPHMLKVTNLGAVEGVAERMELAPGEIGGFMPALTALWGSTCTVISILGVQPL